MDLRDDARSMQDDLVQLRREFHADPEIGLEIPRTQERVLKSLQGLPLEVSTGTSTTSVTAVLRGGKRNAENATTVLLRGDMDALPVIEEVKVDFAAENGAMHACGHDIHTTAMIGAARLLSQHRDSLEGDVVFMFQPGEEGWDGAGAMIKDGILDAAGKRADYAYGMHVFSNRMPSGLFVSRPGSMMSASHGLTVTVHGAGGHGSAPHSALDPISTIAEMITSLQVAVTRSFDIFDPVVITVGVIEGGTRKNIIPDTAKFEATVRRFSEENIERLQTVITRVLEGIAMAHGVSVEIDFHGEYPLTINNNDEVAFSQNVIQELMGEERYEELEKPVSGSEDFSRVLQAVPGAFIGLGACMPELNPDTAPMNHSPRAAFDDVVLSDAVTVYAGLATKRLALAASS